MYKRKKKRAKNTMVKPEPSAILTQNTDLSIKNSAQGQEVESSHHGLEEGGTDEGGGCALCLCRVGPTRGWVTVSRDFVPRNDMSEKLYVTLVVTYSPNIGEKVCYDVQVSSSTREFSQEFRRV